MEMVVANSIQDVKESEWNAFVGSSHVDRLYAWFRTVEDSGIRKMRYIFLRRQKRLTAAVCCQVYSQKVAHLEMPFLEVRCPFAKLPAFFSKSPEHTEALLQGLEQIQAEEKTRGFLILNLRKKEFDVLKDQMNGFWDFQMLGNAYIDLHFTDFDDYLDSLSRKDRGNIRNTMNKARKRWKITSLITNDFSKWKDVAHRLQQYTCQRHEDYRWFLTDQFYEVLEKTLKDNAELLLFFKDDIPLASGLCLNSPDVCQCKAAGIDPRYRKYQAYFLMYYEEIERAIERNQKRIYLGATTYTFKRRIGSKREELFGFVKLKNPLLRLALGSHLTVSKLRGKKF